jgi:hypothetical protein
MTDPSLDDIEDDLYGAPPDDFVRRRAGAVKAAKERGDRELAAEISHLRKPTAAASVLNSFARAHGAEMDALLEFGDRLRDAVDRGLGDDIREAMRERSRLVVELMREVRAYTDEQGESLSASVASQVERSLRAAMVSEADARRLRRGVLPAAIDEQGLDVMDTPNRDTSATVSDGGPSSSDRNRADRARRNAAEERASIAGDVVARGESDLEQMVSRRRALENERDEMRRRLDELDRQLRDVRADEADIESRLDDARSELRAARTAVRRLG